MPCGYKAKRNQPLNEQQKHLNRQWSSVRCTVERVFGVLKQHYGIGKARYLGLKRNQARFMLARWPTTSSAAWLSGPR